MNLKRVLMELGNKLVTEHHFNPGWSSEVPSTAPITDFTNWLNENPEVQVVLEEMGIEWSVVQR